MKKRFEKVYSQGMLEKCEILKDVVSGVHYLVCSNGYGMGITPLLDTNGNIVTYNNLDQKNFDKKEN